MVISTDSRVRRLTDVTNNHYWTLGIYLKKDNSDLDKPGFLEYCYYANFSVSNTLVSKTVTEPGRSVVRAGFIDRLKVGFALGVTTY